MLAYAVAFRLARPQAAPLAQNVIAALRTAANSIFNMKPNIDIANGVLPRDGHHLAAKDHPSVACHLLQFHSRCRRYLSDSACAKPKTHHHDSQIPAHKTSNPYPLTFVTREVGPSQCPESGQS